MDKRRNVPFKAFGRMILPTAIGHESLAAARPIWFTSSAHGLSTRRESTCSWRRCVLRRDWLLLQ